MPWRRLFILATLSILEVSSTWCACLVLSLFANHLSLIKHHRTRMTTLGLVLRAMMLMVEER